MAFRTNKTPDLQEKSASGSVASFNTALAMPLPSCNIAVNAWQEGSGDPSPVNVRNIVPRREVNICNTSGLAEWFKGIYQGVYGFIDLGSLSWGVYNPDTSGHSFITTAPSNLKTMDVNTRPNVMITRYEPSPVPSVSSWVSGDKKIGFPILPNRIMIRDTAYTDKNTFKASLSGLYLVYPLATPTTPTITEAQFNALLSSFGIDGAHYLVNLGEDVYGGSYNSVSGIKSKTHGDKTLNGSENWYDYPSANGFYLSLPQMRSAYNDGLCDKLPRTQLTSNFGIIFGLGNSVIYCTQIKNNISGVTSVTTWKNWLSEHNLNISFPLAEPIESNIGATEIQTFNGANNIFCDTGDTSVVYNDLDLAKRGSFREVFKLP